MRGTIAIALLAGGLITLPANSVGTRQVKDHSLLAKDFKQGELAKAGGKPKLVAVPGPPGPQGPEGAPGVTSTKIVSIDSDPIYAYDPPTTVRATCPEGTVLLSGGYRWKYTFIGDVLATGPVDGAWEVVVRHPSYPVTDPHGDPAPVAVTVQALCGSR
jgi:hypothetical protein